MKIFYVYLLESEIDKSWYIGCTQDIEIRIKQHNAGKTITTNKKKPWQIIYYEVSFNLYDALAREKYLKSGMGRKYLKNRLKLQLQNF